MKSTREQDDVVDIPMTSLIDVVFLLLIFFLVATNFTRKELDQRVDLPVAEGGEAGEFVPENLIVNLRADGTMIINGRVVELDGLRGVMEEWKDGNPGKRVSLRGDGRVSYQQVMAVMGVCRSLEISKIDLPVEAPKGQ